MRAPHPVVNRLENQNERSPGERIKNFRPGHHQYEHAQTSHKQSDKTGGLAATPGPALNRFIQRKVWINSAVSKTAGTTIENAIVQSKLYWSGVNKSRPRYSQSAVRRLNSSNSHHAGAEKQKSSTKSFRERDQIELRVRDLTKASITKT